MTTQEELLHNRVSMLHSQLADERTRSDHMREILRQIVRLAILELSDIDVAAMLSDDAIEGEAQARGFIDDEDTLWNKVNERSDDYESTSS